VTVCGKPSKRRIDIAVVEIKVSHTFEPFSLLLTQVTMGIDALERASTSGDGLLDDEGLVPIYLGTDLVTPRSYTSWEEVDADLTQLEDRLSGVCPDSRQAFAGALLRSLRAAACLFSGGSLSYSTKITDLVGAPAGPVDPAEIDDIRDTLDTLLRSQGNVRGSLTQRITSWEQQHSLPAGKLEATFGELMDAGKARTARRIFDTGDFTMALNPVRDAPYTARCSFDAGRMDLNMDLAFTRAALKHLVAHEVFPGHATQLLLTRARVLKGTSHPETLLCTANTVLGCVQEGIADEGLSLIDWIEDADDQIQLWLRRLRSAVQTTAAWQLMVDQHPASDVADYLRDAGAGQEAWVQGRLRMAAHPFRGPFIASYWAGARAVRRVFERVTPTDFPRFVDYLYGNAHSPQSLEMFS
jgi:hypothetical protein